MNTLSFPTDICTESWMQEVLEAEYNRERTASAKKIAVQLPSLPERQDSPGLQNYRVYPLEIPSRPRAPSPLSRVETFNPPIPAIEVVRINS